MTFQKRVGRFKGTPLWAALLPPFLNRRARERWRHAHISTAELRLHVMAMRFVSTVLHLARHTAFSSNRRCLLPSFGALARGGARRLDVRVASSAPPPAPINISRTSSSGTSTGTATACSTAAASATAAIARDTNRLLVIGRTQRDAAQLEARLSPLVPRRSASQSASASEVEPTHAFSLEFASRDSFLGSITAAAASSNDPHSSAPPPPPPRQLQFDIPLFLSVLRTETLGSVLMYSDRVTSTQSILSECVLTTTRGSLCLRRFAQLAETKQSIDPKTNTYAMRSFAVFAIRNFPSHSSNRYFGSVKEPIVFAATTQVSGKGALSLILNIHCDLN